jgi:hypothetical protein
MIQNILEQHKSDVVKKLAATYNEETYKAIEGFIESQDAVAFTDRIQYLITCSAELLRDDNEWNEDDIEKMTSDISTEREYREER